MKPFVWLSVMGTVLPHPVALLGSVTFSQCEIRLKALCVFMHSVSPLGSVGRRNTGTVLPINPSAGLPTAYRDKPLPRHGYATGGNLGDRLVLSSSVM